MYSLLRAATLTLTLVVLAACADAPTVATPTIQSPTTFPPPTIYPAGPTAKLVTPILPITSTLTPEPMPTQLVYDGQWYEVKPGKQGMDYMLAQQQVNGQSEWLLIVRLDPSRVDLRVRYDPESPRSARDWHLQTGSDLIINGGFFDERNRATGLVISDGQSFGRSYRGFGGMLAWRDGLPELTWLREEPYRHDRNITQAVQAFPMLVMDAQPVEGISDDGERNRRSFVGLDRDGRLLLGVTQMAQWTLTDLATFLASSPDLNLVRALNLDGGASSGLWLGGNLDGVSMNSFDPVPSVIAVTVRE